MSKPTANHWGADTLISMPEAPERPIRRNYGGIGMTDTGPSPALTEADREEAFAFYFTPIIVDQEAE